MQTWTRRVAVALGLGVVVLLAVAVADAGAPGSALAGVEERLAHVEGRLEELSRRISDLQWMVGLGVGWLTAVVAAAVGIVLKFGLRG
jgi:hypothetical protein